MANRVSSFVLGTLMTSAALASGPPDGDGPCQCRPPHGSPAMRRACRRRDVYCRYGRCYRRYGYRHYRCYGYGYGYRPYYYAPSLSLRLF